MPKLNKPRRPGVAYTGRQSRSDRGLPRVVSRRIRFLREQGYEVLADEITEQYKGDNGL